MSNSSKSFKVVTGIVRFSYVNVFAPLIQGQNKPHKYSVALIIPKEDDATVDDINKAVYDCKIANRHLFEKDNVDVNDLKGGLRDGDLEKNDPAYDGCYFINATSTVKPKLVDANLEEIKKSSHFYSGCYGRASITFYAYNNGPTLRGIGCTINNLQKLYDGDKLGNFSHPEDDFKREEPNYQYPKAHKKPSFNK